jgi:hypothetical protein
MLVQNACTRGVESVALCAVSVLYMPLQQRKTDNTREVLNGRFLCLGLGDISFCKGDPHNFTKSNQLRYRMDGIKAMAVGALCLRMFKYYFGCNNENWAARTEFSRTFNLG